MPKSVAPRTKSSTNSASKSISGPGAGPTPSDSNFSSRQGPLPTVGHKAPHNAVLTEKNAKRGQKVDGTGDSPNGSSLNGQGGTVSPVDMSPKKVNNTKGIGLEDEEEEPETRTVSPVIYDLPRNKQGDFERILFLNPLEKKYVCPVCKDFMRYPVQFEDCGHRCCSSCLQDLLRVNPKCVIDNKPIEKEKTFPDSAISREIGGLKCRCSNSTLGCQWVGEVRSVCGHQTSDCRFVPMDCPNRCGENFERRHLDTHISNECNKRSMHCAHCSDIIPAKEFELHEKECPAVKISCPSECGAHRRRSDMEKHLKDECGSNKVHCTYYEAGCLHMCARSELNKHLRTDALLHVDMLAKLLFETRKLVNQHQDVVGGTSNFLSNLGNSSLSFEKAVGSQLLWRIDGLTEKIAQCKRGEKLTQYSKQFYSGPHGYKLIAATNLNGGGPGGTGQHLPIYIFICKGEYDSLLPWPFKAEITFTLMDVRPDFDTREDITYTFKPNPEDPQLKDALARPTKDRNPYFGVSRFAPLAVIDQKSNYIENDTIYIQIVISQQDIPAV